MVINWNSLLSVLITHGYEERVTWGFDLTIDKTIAPVNKSRVHETSWFAP